jgi:crotonobetainyl-CoA:carnitine CoA-transferase CaiB-like acyl-CoA transferase
MLVNREEVAMAEQALSDVKVLDLTWYIAGLYCTKLLADYGADVIKVERPGGDPARNMGPFYKDIPHPEKSLFWFFTNTSKRGITLNLETGDGRDIFKRLAKAAHFVIESFEPGYMDRLGLGYPDLEKLNPGVIMTSITPFGQSGPYAHFKGSDMVVWALGGMMYLHGDPDRPPVQLSVPQAYFHGGIHAAMGSVMALYYREMAGEGQHVDVSIQDAVDFTNQMADEVYDILGMNMFRTGALYSQVRPEPMGVLYQRVNWECKDGCVSAFFRGGSLGDRAAARAMVAWMRREDMAGELEAYDWDTYNFATLTQEERWHLEEPIAKFLKTKTKKELFERAVRDGIILAPVSTVKDAVESEQLQARSYWVRVEHPELTPLSSTETGRAITYPGASVRASAAPWRVYRRAPLIGEHNEEIYIGELAFTGEQLAMLKARRVI